MRKVPASLAKRPEVGYESREVIYGPQQWELLDTLRTKALGALKALAGMGIEAFVYGSVARGDVTSTSDIDIVVPRTVSSYKIELALGSCRRKELVQATPSSVLKGHLHYDDVIVVSFPIFRMRSREIDFYTWGGSIGRNDMSLEVRVPGVDKRLVLIEPTDRGHMESGVIGYEELVAKKLGLSPPIALERVRVLTRREGVGRTGVYLTRVLDSDESIEKAAKSLIDANPALRRTERRRTLG
jgi:predicted nucleotidyltransferase